MPGPVERWLETFMCKHYADTFEAYGFKTLQSVCQLQLPQLQAMGVAQEHCERILDNVHVLRQSLFGSMSHFPDDMYSNNRMSNMGYQNSNQGMVNMHGNMSGYGHQGYSNQGQSSMMMMQQSQYPRQDGMYSSHSQTQYMGYASPGPGQFSAPQYPPSDGGGGAGGGYNHMTGNNGYQGGPMNSHQQLQQTPVHPHMRHMNANQNPQEVANNILQMAAISYMPNQTVQVPLSKNRSAPYHVPPKSPHNFCLQGKGTSPNQQKMGSNRQFVYPNSSPHHPTGARTSPISPSPGYNMQSPASHHSAQSLPNSSPHSMHSPSHSIGSGCVKSPSTMTPSPVQGLKSPCQIQSPMNSCQSVGLTTPVNQQLHVSVSAGQQMYQGQMSSPNQQKLINRYSPKTNPISPPASRSQVNSPYTCNTISKSSIHSPQHTEPYTSPSVNPNYLSEGSSRDPSNPPQTNSNSSNPLQSLQKLCMLPERQVIDPKSVVNDTSLGSPQSCDNQKNLNSGVDMPNNDPSQDDVSAPINTPQSPGKQSDKENVCIDTNDLSKPTENKKFKEENKYADDILMKGDDESETIINECMNDLMMANKTCDDQDNKNSIEADLSRNVKCTEIELDTSVQSVKDDLDTNRNSIEADSNTNEKLVEADLDTNVESGNVDLDTNKKSVDADIDNCGNCIKNDLDSHTVNTVDSDLDVNVNSVNNDLDANLRSVGSLHDNEKKKDEQNKTEDKPLQKEEEVKSESVQCDSSDISADVMCNLEQCKNSCLVELNGCEQILCKTSSCQQILEKGDLDKKDLEYEKMAKENNNEIVSGLNGDSHSCIQYYRPKSVKKSKRLKNKILKTNIDKSIRGKILSNVNENPVLCNESISSHNHIAEKQLLRRSQAVRTRSLRGVPARLANAAQYSSAMYSDSDSDDDGVLLVRKDLHTYDRSSYSLIRNNMFNISDGISSQDADISSGNESDKESKKQNCDDFTGDGILKVSEVAFDSAANDSKNMADDSAKSQSKVRKKTLTGSDEEASKRTKSPPGITSTMRTRRSESRQTEINSVGKNFVNSDKSVKRNSRSRKKSDCKESAEESDDEPDGISFPNSSAKVSTHSASNKKRSVTSSAFNSSHSVPTSNKRSRRKRRRTSPMKYGDLYYGADYVIDSEEEMEIEKQSKRERKGSFGKKEPVEEDSKVPESIVIEDSEDEEVEEIEDEEGDQDLKVSNKSPDKGNVQVKKTNSKMIEVEDDKPVLSEPKPGTSKNTKEKVKQPLSNSKYDKKTEKSKNSKSGKGKLKKLEKSRKKLDMFDSDSMETMKLQRTLDIMKKKGKKKDKSDIIDNKVPGPYIQINNNKSEPSSCHVINQPDADQQAGSKKVTKKRVMPVLVSTVHMSKLSSDKSINVPSNSLLDESNWVCALCNKHSSFKFLGDLFGPYYIEGNLPPQKETETGSGTSAGDGNKNKKKRSLEQNMNSSSGADVGKGQKTKSNRKSSTSKSPQEVWVHEDCVAWADGVLLIGAKVYGLEEASVIASATTCSACKEIGAMVGCLHKGCSQKFHYTCAVEYGCYMDEENFSLLCPKHKGKIMKKVEKTNFLT